MVKSIKQKQVLMRTTIMMKRVKKRSYLTKIIVRLFIIKVFSEYCGRKPGAEQLCLLYENGTLQRSKEMCLVYQKACARLH
jgi:hypothetical protein